MLEDYDGLDLAGLVRGRHVSALDLVDMAIGRIERLNGALNAVVTPMFDLARDRARQPLAGGPFAGVPFLAKDLMLFIPGVPLSNGSRAMRGYVPAAECALARTIREAGLVVLGKTNTSELGASPLTNPKAFGPTRNPWDLSRNSGGSSGGSTAAVAARIVPLASSSDGGGSIRLPASYCGVFGFKPGRGVNPYDSPKAWGGAVVSHVTTISVRDSAAYLDWTAAGIAVEDPASPRPGSFLDRARTPPGTLRVGFCVDSPLGTPVHPDCVAAVHGAARLLESLGHRVEPCRMPYDGRELLRAFLTVVMAYTARDLRDMADWLGTTSRGLAIEPTTRFMGEVGRGVSEAQLAAALEVWAAMAERMRRFHQDFDVLVTPVTTTPPLEHGALGPRMAEAIVMTILARSGLARRLFSGALVDHAIDANMTALPFTEIANVTGQPAMSVPLYWNDADLPVGVQMLAAHGHDGLLFSLAAQVEQAAPWRHRLPPMCRNQPPP